MKLSKPSSTEVKRFTIKAKGRGDRYSKFTWPCVVGLSTQTGQVWFYHLMVICGICKLSIKIDVLYTLYWNIENLITSYLMKKSCSCRYFLNLAHQWPSFSTMCAILFSWWVKFTCDNSKSSHNGVLQEVKLCDPLITNVIKYYGAQTSYFSLDFWVISQSHLCV